MFSYVIRSLIGVMHRSGIGLLTVVVLLYVHINELVGLLEKYGVKVNALVIRRTVLHDDLSVLAIRRTTQMNSRPTEAKWRFAWVMSLISTNQTTYESYGED